MAAAEPHQESATPPAAQRVKASNPIYGDILDLLNEEAALLDDDLHKEWLNCFTEDITYVMPVRTTLYRRDGRGFDETSFHFNDNLKSLQLRVRRSVDVRSAYDRDPAPRIRRFISNITVRESGTQGEFFVTSNILLLRNRFDNPQFDVLAAKREDTIRSTDNGMKIARRRILVDQAALGASYLNVFM